MSLEQAATLPVSLQTMHNAIVTASRMEKSDAVLIRRQFRCWHSRDANRQTYGCAILGRLPMRSAGQTDRIRRRHGAGFQ